MLNLDELIEPDQREPFRFTHGGQVYELPPDIDLRLASKTRGADPLAQLEEFLGADQWSRIMASDTPLTPKMLVAVTSSYGEYLRVPLGESAASSSS